jgi:hypothetical protein
MADLIVRDKTTESMNVAVSERYWKRPPRLVELLLLTDAEGVDGAGWERLPSWGGEEAKFDEKWIDGEIRRRTQTGTPVGFWSAWRLAVMANPDAVLPSTLREFHHVVANTRSGSSLWMVDVNDTATLRLTAMRGLFAFEHAPELVARAPADFEGFISARGLSAGFGVVIGPLVAVFCSWLAPSLIGVSAERRAGSIVTLANGPWDGLETATPGDMLQLFSPSLLVQARPGREPWPPAAPETFVAALSWWIRQCNDLVFLLTDLARFRNQDGFYDRQPIWRRCSASSD